jgi:hypothetical protein
MIPSYSDSWSDWVSRPLASETVFKSNRKLQRTQNANGKKPDALRGDRALQKN